MSDSRVPLLRREEVADERLRSVLDRAAVSSAPKPEWYLAIGHAPDVAVGYDAFWNLTYRDGSVEHTTKELMRLTITSAFECAFCSTQRSSEALEQGLDESELTACTVGSYRSEDPRIDVAVEYARALATDVLSGYNGWDELYERLRSYYSAAELAELICFCANTVGGTLVARTLNLPTATAEVESKPDAALA